MYFSLYKDMAGQWRWMLYAANNKKIADSGESYWKADAQHGIGVVMSTNVGTPIYER
jgi:uncharacterized protein YegP (UPF0339 family)